MPAFIVLSVVIPVIMAADTSDAVPDDDSGGRDRSSRIEQVDRKQDEMFERINDLREDAANEQVETLAELLQVMASELCRLEARNRQLTSRLETVETVNGLAGDEIDLSDVSALDHRDKKVVKAIVTDGRELVSLEDLRKLYRGHTDVRSKETLRKRTKALTATDLFERERSGLHTTVWRFVGSNHVSS